MDLKNCEYIKCTKVTKHAKCTKCMVSNHTAYNQTDLDGSQMTSVHFVQILHVLVCVFLILLLILNN